MHWLKLKNILIISFPFLLFSPTEKYDPATDCPKANPKVWKANFRCAINSLPDIEELREKGKTKGNDAYKVYRLHPKKSKRQSRDAEGEFHLVSLLIYTLLSYSSCTRYLLLYPFLLAPDPSLWDYVRMSFCKTG